MRERRPPRARKRWTFMSAAEYLSQGTNASIYANPAGAARLMAWAVGRVAGRGRKDQTRDWFVSAPFVKAIMGAGWPGPGA